MVVRLSHKAQEAAGAIGARIEGIIRSMASKRAEADGREYADLNDVHEAHRLYWLQVCKEYMAAEAQEKGLTQ